MGRAEVHRGCFACKRSDHSWKRPRLREGKVAQVQTVLLCWEAALQLCGPEQPRTRGKRWHKRPALAHLTRGSPACSPGTSSQACCAGEGPQQARQAEHPAGGLWRGCTAQAAVSSHWQQPGSNAELRGLEAAATKPQQAVTASQLTRPGQQLLLLQRTPIACLKCSTQPSGTALSRCISCAVGTSTSSACLHTTCAGRGTHPGWRACTLIGSFTTPGLASSAACWPECLDPGRP